MITLKTLHSFESNHSVADILCAYYDSCKQRLMDSLIDDIDGMVDYWATCNDCAPSNIIDCIDCHMNDMADFKVLKDVGSSGGWPDCLLKIGDFEFFMDWVIDE